MVRNVGLLVIRESCGMMSSRLPLAANSLRMASWCSPVAWDSPEMCLSYY